MCKGLETRSQEGRFGLISLMRFGLGQAARLEFTPSIAPEPAQDG